MSEMSGAKTILHGDAVAAGLSNYMILHLFGKYYVVKTGGAYTHWCYFDRITNTRTVFHEMSETQSSLMKNDSMLHLLQELKKYSLDIRSLGTNTVKQGLTCFTTCAGIPKDVFFLKELHYSYVFIHVNKNSVYSHRIYKNTYIAPYFNVISEIPVSGVFNNVVGCCELLELICKSSIKFPFSPNELKSIALVENVYKFVTQTAVHKYTVQNGKLFRLEVNNTVTYISQQILSGEKIFAVDYSEGVLDLVKGMTGMGAYGYDYKILPKDQIVIYRL